ncbi:MAG: hypothetical protein LBI68_08395 [Azoarcus sp.]|jgi:hypothetical protein|nr:hypothetical protein [Azoarcus sp.]
MAMKTKTLVLAVTMLAIAHPAYAEEKWAETGDIKAQMGDNWATLSKKGLKALI